MTVRHSSAKDESASAESKAEEAHMKKNEMVRSIVSLTPSNHALPCSRRLFRSFVPTVHRRECAKSCSLRLQQYTLRLLSDSNAGQAGMTCDCTGTNLCTIDTCFHNIASNGSLANALELGASVSCIVSQNIQCVRRTGELPVENLPPQPLEYRQLQFGPASVTHMYNVTNFVDTNGVISPDVSMHGLWPGYLRLRNRFIHVRVYESANTSETLLCAIYNAYHLPSDGLGLGSTSVEIEGLNGQLLAWRACDDTGECLGGPATTLYASHSYVDNLSDGWCVTPLEKNGNGIRVTFSNVTGMYGIDLQSPGYQFEYLWTDPPQHGMTGVVDANGFSVGGSASFTINLNGIPVPP
ncbi:hypothetical protein FGB62_19g292 [Gracilaria domingensis]|nr:hypothetical protein FGB62_19g292 [Gracilaria domingensis]